MKKYLLPFSYFAIFSMLVFSFSCRGQVKTGANNSISSDQPKAHENDSKLTLTQGSNQADNVHCGLQDRAGNLWFGTTGEGIYRISTNESGVIVSEIKQFTVKDGLNSNTVWSIYEDIDGRIWAGTDKGLCRYDPSFSKGKAFLDIPIEVSSGQNFLLNNQRETEQSSKLEVNSILQDKNRTLWFGTSRGLYYYSINPISGKYGFELLLDDPTIKNPSRLSLKNIQCIFQDKSGNIWLGSGPMSFEGICRFDGQSLTQFKPENESWIRKILADKNGKLLFVTRHIGVLTFDGINFSHEATPKELRNDLFNDLLIDKKGNSWYASDYLDDSDFSSGGLWKFDGMFYQQITKKDGISNTAVFYMFEDNTGNIWMGTRKTGLFRYNPNAEKSDGLLFTNFTD